MANMQVAIRLRWEPCDDRGVLASLEVVVNYLADEVPRWCIAHE